MPVLAERNLMLVNQNNMPTLVKVIFLLSTNTGFWQKVICQFNWNKAFMVSTLRSISDLKTIRIGWKRRVSGYWICVSIIIRLLSVWIITLKLILLFAHNIFSLKIQEVNLTTFHRTFDLNVALTDKCFCYLYR